MRKYSSLSVRGMKRKLIQYVTLGPHNNNSLQSDWAPFYLAISFNQTVNLARRMNGMYLCSIVVGVAPMGAALTTALEPITQRERVVSHRPGSTVSPFSN